jgi:hypothetical protein
VQEGREAKSGGEKKEDECEKMLFYTSLYTFLDEKIYHVNLPNDPMIKSDNRPRKKSLKGSRVYMRILCTTLIVELHH